MARERAGRPPVPRGGPRSMILVETAPDDGPSGDLWSIDREIICRPGDSSDASVDRRSVAYGWIRGAEDEDDEVAPRHFPSLTTTLREEDEGLA